MRVRRWIAAGLTGAAIAVTGLTQPAQAATYYEHSCFGVEGHFRTPNVVEKSWYGNPRSEEECFGVGKNRKIYHIWKTMTHKRWVEMPGRGRADDIYRVQKGAGGRHEVFVVVYSSPRPVYFKSYLSPRGWTQWRRTSAVSGGVGG